MFIVPQDFPVCRGIAVDSGVPAGQLLYSVDCTVYCILLGVLYSIPGGAEPQGDPTIYLADH